MTTEPSHFIVLRDVPFDGFEIVYVSSSIKKARAHVRDSSYRIQEWRGKNRIRTELLMAKS